MLAVCAWCTAVLRPRSANGPPGITHGICPACFDRVAADAGCAVKFPADRPVAAATPPAAKR